MTSRAAPSPNPDEASPAHQSIRNVVEHNDNVVTGIAESVRLFSEDYDAVSGKLAAFMPTKWPALKCAALDRRNVAMAVTLPVKKRRVNVSLSPHCTAFVATAATAVRLVNAVVLPSITKYNNPLPPAVRCLMSLFHQHQQKSLHWVMP